MLARMVLSAKLGRFQEGPRQRLDLRALASEMPFREKGQRATKACSRPVLLVSPVKPGRFQDQHCYGLGLRVYALAVCQWLAGEKSLCEDPQGFEAWTIIPILHPLEWLSRERPSFEF